MNIIMYTIYGLSMCLVAVVFHELGHYITFRAMGIKPKLVVENWVDPALVVNDKMTPAGERLVYMNGILAGLVPFVAAGGIMLPFALVYMWGCHSDIGKIMRKQ